jgi:uncharacterized protein YjiS (DUF1127 family)
MIYLSLSNARCRQFGESLMRSALLGKACVEGELGARRRSVELRFKLSCYRRCAAWALSQLSDHDLSDIGIGRGDIEYVARRPRREQGVRLTAKP